MKVLLDSSIWIEIFAGGPKSKTLEKYLKAPYKNILPSIVAYEVYKKIKAHQGEQTAVMLLAQIERLSHEQVPVDQALAIQAADLGLKHQIPMADAMILATAITSNATLVTRDAHFKNISQVEYIK